MLCPIANDRETTPPRATPTETAGPVEIPYQVLEEASGNFNQLPYKEGGHKLGEGGFGEVFHCLLRLGGGAPVEAAVKVLSNKVGGAEEGGVDQEFIGCLLSCRRAAVVQWTSSSLRLSCRPSLCELLYLL